jgi:hypothetical protein
MYQREHTCPCCGEILGMSEEEILKCEDDRLDYDEEDRLMD